MSEKRDERVHIFQPPSAPPRPTRSGSVVRWECPHCHHRNPFDDGMDREVVPCLACGKLARPNAASLNEATTPGQLANVRKLLDW